MSRSDENPLPQEPVPIEQLLGQMMDALCNEDQLSFVAKGGIEVSRMSEAGVADLVFDMVLIRCGTRASRLIRLLSDAMAYGPGTPETGY